MAILRTARFSRTVLALSALLSGCSSHPPPVATPAPVSQDVQFKTMWDDIYERLKPEIQNGSIVVERGNAGTPSLSPAGSHIAKHDVRPPSAVQPPIDGTPPVKPTTMSATGHAPETSMILPSKASPADISTAKTSAAEYSRVRFSDRVLFASGDDRISEDGIAVLGRLGAILKDEENIQIAIQGHTDDKPIRDRLRQRFEDNQALSQARASNAASILARSGIPQQWLTLQWFGESQPLLPNDSEEGRRKNRRVEILIAPKETP
ncbi:MAG: OmpA family protein [Nitrospira sp.]|nr:OmpA family protein [Nitrospira sp.]